ncbi:MULTISPECIES: FadR/GntR family transcriptional regulator [Thermomonosporaceae]|uniref:FadR/GntR family transcriptional regulator n=1 Tax=Thermomonosporaceae TaxID=2012 RepID=UPI00255ACD69|nr:MULTISPECIES: FCD domain-containing protein [Thermomonosporaceae]MDL4774411.1 FCD domain-containing protein [Actinomadura xylanilytica]
MVHDPLGPLRPARTGEQVAHRLATAIALGEFTLGDRLPSERDLATLLQVSRESVRAALRLLAGSGLVETRRGRGGGAFVRAEWGEVSESAVRGALLDRWEEFEQLFDYRRLVEAMIARTAAERATGADRDAVRRALAGFDGAATPAEAREFDVALHQAVARATGNPRLVRLHERLLSEVSLGVSAEPYTWAIYEEARPHHHALADAITAGDGDAAARIAERHFAITEVAVRRLADRVGRPEPERPAL